MDDQRLLRYSRHLLLPAIDLEGQQRVFDARVLVVGAGGLGSAVVPLLLAAGVGMVVVCDPDTVDWSNLPRQLMHGPACIGRAKVDSVCDTAERLGAEGRVVTLQAALDDALGERWIPEVDVVIDCSDNFATRFRVNRLTRRFGKPLVSGAAIRFEGHLAVFDPRDPQSPCYQCLYPDGDEGEQRCTDNGVFSPVVAVVGALQAAEALKLVIGTGRAPVGRLWVWDALVSSWRSLGLKRDPRCPECGAP